MSHVSTSGGERPSFEHAKTIVLGKSKASVSHLIRGSN